MGGSIRKAIRAGSEIRGGLTLPVPAALSEKGLLVAIVFFAVAMLVPGALLFIGYRVSSVIGKVAAGLAASVVMVLELWLATSLAGIGSATSGSQAAYGIVKVSAFMFLCALLLYIVACIAKNEDDDTNHNSGGSQ